MRIHRNKGEIPAYKKSNNDKSGLIKNNLTVDTLDMLCRYVVSESQYLRKVHLLNLRKMIGLMDRESYRFDPSLDDRYRFIGFALEARLDLGLENKGLIINYIKDRFDGDMDFLEYDREISLSEITYLSDIVSENINFAYVGKKIDEMEVAIAEYKAAQLNGTGRGPALDSFYNVLNDVQRTIRHNQTDTSTDITFSLEEDVYRDAIETTYNTVTSPSNTLLCGMQGMNMMTGGGFESGRCYMYFGITGGGKSILALNLLDQIRTSNPNYKPKDLTKRPCVVYLTMENRVIETICRYYNLLTGQDMKKASSAEEAFEMFESHGLKLTDENSIDVFIRYKANRSVDTTYLYTLKEELEAEGYEMMCLIQDHVKRIRSESNEKDIRLELGEVVNQFKSFAIYADIPVISVSHINRAGASIIEDNLRSGNRNHDITKELGKSVIGESFLMLDNLDGGYLIQKMEVDNQTYMAMKTVKKRENATLDYFAQPFVGNSIQLVKDIDTEPAYKTSLNNINNPVNLNDPMELMKRQNLKKPNMGRLQDMLESYSKPKKNQNKVEDTKPLMSPFIEMVPVEGTPWMVQKTA